LVRNAEGREGWVPLSTVEPVAEQWPAPVSPTVYRPPRLRLVSGLRWGLWPWSTAVLHPTYVPRGKDWLRGW